MKKTIIDVVPIEGVINFQKEMVALSSPVSHAFNPGKGRICTLGE
jgi:hypothetical protein